jgi:hypothetical protein
MMTRKDYKVIAGAVYATRTATSEDKQGTLTYLENQLAFVLANDNPRFDRARFLNACQTGKGV